MKDFISFIDFTNMSDEEKYKLLNKKDYEIERLNTTLNNIHNYIEKMSYCDIVDNPKKELVRILEKEGRNSE